MEKDLTKLSEQLVNVKNDLSKKIESMSQQTTKNENLGDDDELDLFMRQNEKALAKSEL